MSITVSSDDIVARLRTMLAAEVEPLLDTVSYLPLAYAVVRRDLAAAGLTEDGLNPDQETLAKALAIAYVCERVIAGAPVRKVKGGMIEVAGVSAEDKRVALDQIGAEIARLKDALGVPMGAGPITSAGGADYEPIDLGDS